MTLQTASHLLEDVENHMADAKDVLSLSGARASEARQPGGLEMLSLKSKTRLCLHLKG